MWPGDQHGGQQHPPQGGPPQQQQGQYGQPPNPYAQPAPSQAPGYAEPPQYPPTQPYGTPNPYAQPGYQAPPPPPGGYPTPQQWGPLQPGAPEGPPPPDNRRKRTTIIAIAASVAVIAAAVVAAVALTGGGKKDDAGKQTQNPASPTATTASPSPTTPSPTETGSPAGGGGDDPRGAPGSTDVKAVIPGWKVVKRSERNAAFDVPPDWTVDDEGMTIGFSDKSGNPAVAMGAPAYYKADWCKTGSSTADRGAAGTKGANGAKSVRDAAEVQATSWAYWAYQDNGKGTFSKALDSKPFHNAHGISGWQAQATATDIPKTSKCSADGEAYAVAWLDPTQTDPTKRLVVWVLYCDRGVPDQLAQSTIDRIKSSIRLIKTK